MTYPTQAVENAEIYLNAKRIISNMLLQKQISEAALYLVTSFNTETVEKLGKDLKDSLPNEITEDFLDLVEVMCE